MSELLPCPFCGTREQGPTKLVSVTLGQVAMVECRQCGTLTRTSTWNTRHTPEGWQAVPAEPTYDMMQAGYWSGSGDVSINDGWARREVWKRMLAAAPKPEDE